MRVSFVLNLNRPLGIIRLLARILTEPPEINGDRSAARLAFIPVTQALDVIFARFPLGSPIAHCFTWSIPKWQWRRQVRQNTTQEQCLKRHALRAAGLLPSHGGKGCQTRATGRAKSDNHAVVKLGRQEMLEPSSCRRAQISRRSGNRHDDAPTHHSVQKLRCRLSDVREGDRRDHLLKLVHVEVGR